VPLVDDLPAITAPVTAIVDDVLEIVAGVPDVTVGLLGTVPPLVAGIVPAPPAPPTAPGGPSLTGVVTPPTNPAMANPPSAPSIPVAAGSPVLRGVKGASPSVPVAPLPVAIAPAPAREAPVSAPVREPAPVLPPAAPVVPSLAAVPPSPDPVIAPTAPTPDPGPVAVADAIVPVPAAATNTTPATVATAPVEVIPPETVETVLPVRGSEDGPMSGWKLTADAASAVARTVSIAPAASPDLVTPERPAAPALQEFAWAGGVSDHIARITPVTPRSDASGAAASPVLSGGSAPMAALPWRLTLPLIAFLFFLARPVGARAPASPAYDPAVPPA
jgi:hypothetical protein